MDKVKAIDQIIMARGQELNSKFLKKANAIWKQGRVDIESYPLFIKVCLYKLWKKHAQRN